MEERRLARLVVPGHAAGTVVVDASGRLPAVEFTLVPGDTTVYTLVHSVLPALGLGDRVLDCFVNQTELPPPDDPVPVLVELPQLTADRQLPDGWRETPTAAAELDVEAALRGRLHDWIDTRHAPARNDRLRPPWGRPGWFERAADWIVATLGDADLPAPTSIAQFRHWGISAVMRVDSGADRYWFKAVSQHFRREAGITAFLDRQAPGSVARVIGVDIDRGWLLLGDLGSHAGHPDPHDLREPFEYLIELQRRFIGRETDLVAAGCDPRPLTSIPHDLARVLDDPIVCDWLDVPPDRAQRQLEWLHEAVRGIDALGLPDLLVHGDFHPGNVVATGDGRRVLFDWSDAAISKPFVDVLTWASWMPDDAEGQDALWLTFAELWSDVVPVDVWSAMRPTLEGVAGAYHVVSYAGIVSSLDPFRRPEHAIGLVDFYGFLDAAVPA
jgi:hypothetical protein